MLRKDGPSVQLRARTGTKRCLPSRPMGFCCGRGGNPSSGPDVNNMSVQWRTRAMQVMARMRGWNDALGLTNPRIVLRLEFYPEPMGLCQL